jgi:hypothetical protein
MRLQKEPAQPGSAIPVAPASPAVRAIPDSSPHLGNRKTGRIANNPSFSAQAIPTKKPGENYFGFLLDPL